VDPLRPFADLIRQWMRARAAQSGSARPAAQPNRVSAATQGPYPPPLDREIDLRQRLRLRLNAATMSDPANARRVFVETVVSWELGDDLQSDPQFSQLVSVVTGQLAEQPSVADRLHQLLVHLTRE
jgi:hypothetical protein